MDQLSQAYVFVMVQSMYKYEANLVKEDRLLTDAEMMDFYRAFIGK